MMDVKWPVVELQRLIDTKRGVSYGIVQPGAAVVSGVPIVRVSDVRGGRISTQAPLRVSQEIEAAYSRTRLRGGELLITIVGTVGETAIVPDSLAGWNVARAIAVLPVNDDIGAYWLQLALQAPLVRETINSRLNTTVQATLNLGDLTKLPILLPPKEERARIASIIGALDDKIDINRRMNETLEVMARAIFKDWFVDFGPTRAKMEGRAPYLAPDIWSLFPDRLDDDGKPEGWEFGTLGEIARLVGATVNPDALGSETPYIGLEHMPRRSVALGEWEGAGKVTSGKLSFSRGDLLFGKLRPHFHKVGIAPIDGICSTDIVVLNARKPTGGAFVLACISQDDFVAYTDRTSDGTKMPRTSWGRMERYGLCIPSEAVFQIFDDSVSPLIKRIVANIHETRTLAASRDLLLPKLMSGEIRIKDAERVGGGAP